MIYAVALIFPVLMAFAAWSDLLTMTISNAVSVLLVAVFVVLALATGMSPGTLATFHLLPGFAVLVLTFMLFARGWIGGGDAKLAAATAVWLGWDNLLDYGLEASIIGGALTLSVLGLRKVLLPGFALDRAWIVRLHDPGNGVPYGIALALSGLLIYPDTALWQAVVAS